MMRNTCGSLMCMMAIFLFASTVQCRVHRLGLGTARNLQAHGLKNTNNTATALDESKLYLIFCEESECQDPTRGCYCCWNQQPEPLCYDDMDTCRTVCPCICVLMNTKSEAGRQHLLELGTSRSNANNLMNTSDTAIALEESKVTLSNDFIVTVVPNPSRPSPLVSVQNQDDECIMRRRGVASGDTSWG
ncbi:hypothetical protein EJB05_35445 [Eragrostis curvula]|uniref:Embryo surrounding factor 1 brassicaceae domain-containing protein n=1 Tax=Eragrostis curvula TaxID=38414 RepID=A0A5J9U6V7_9POAL|nr:hypothetical protein EJB05_35445 [Eragrostis curvula]